MLGKVLEAIVAARLQNLAEQHVWFSLFHAGGIRGRGPIDSAHATVQQMNAEAVQNKKSALVVMGIKGAYSDMI